MKIKKIHRWDVTLSEAKEIQLNLSKQIELIEFKNQVSLIGGVDVSFNLRSNILYAAAVIRNSENME